MTLAVVMAAGTAEEAATAAALAFEAAGVIGIVVIVGVTAFARRLRVAAPILLVLVGTALSFLPGLPERIVIPPALVLDGLLPPILYAAAIRLSFVDFRRNLGTILSLSVVLVVATAVGTGLTLYALVTELQLAAGIALGAVLSPPDAVAATAVGRRLGLPPRLLVVLEGEGLVNDATALVLFGAAATLAASKTQQPDPLLTVETFLFSVVVAGAIGFAVGFVTVRVRARLEDPVLATAISIAVPFLAFAPTSAFGASGVLAVVVAGLYTGYANPGAFSAVTRISDRINWSTIQFLLENAVFLLIGLQVRTLVEEVNDAPSSLPLAATIVFGLLATALLIALRFLWVGPLVLLLRLREQHAEASTLRALLLLQQRFTDPVHRPLRSRVGRLRRRYARRRADLEQLRTQSIDWRGGIVLGWSGMRGVVTLAAAQALPEVPLRPQLILIAFTVAVVSLLLQGATLPGLIRLLGIRSVDVAEDQRRLAELLEELSYAGLSVLDDPGEIVEGAGDVDPEIIERVRRASYLRAEAAWERSRSAGLPLDATPHRLFRQLRLAVVEAEREHLLELRSQGVYPPRIEAQAQALLDLEETRLRPPTAPE